MGFSCDGINLSLDFIIRRKTCLLLRLHQLGASGVQPHPCCRPSSGPREQPSPTPLSHLVKRWRGAPSARNINTGERASRRRGVREEHPRTRLSLRPSVCMSVCLRVRLFVCLSAVCLDLSAAADHLVSLPHPPQCHSRTTHPFFSL